MPTREELDEMFSLLKLLCERGGVSGYEDEVREAVVELVKDYADEVRVDSLGSVIAAKRGSGSFRFMVAAHMDEIGFMVRHVSEKGFLHFTAVGGWDERILPGTRVKVRTGEEPGSRG